METRDFPARKSVETFRPEERITAVAIDVTSWTSAGFTAGTSQRPGLARLGNRGMSGNLVQPRAIIPKNLSL